MKYIIFSAFFASMPGMAMALDCNPGPDEIVAYCNDFETRNPISNSRANMPLFTPFSDAVAANYPDFDGTAISPAYEGTETRTPGIMVNGVANAATVILQQNSVETLTLNKQHLAADYLPNILHSGYGNGTHAHYRDERAGAVGATNYAIGMVASSKPNSDPASAITSHDVITFSFDAKSPDDTPLNNARIQLDLSAAFLLMRNTGTAANYRPWQAAPKIRIRVFDGSNTEIAVGAGPSLNFSAMGAPLLDTIKTGVLPAYTNPNPLTDPIFDYPITWAPITVDADLSTLKAGNTNRSITVALEMIREMDTENSPSTRYALFDNLRISAQLQTPVGPGGPSSASAIPATSPYSLLAMVALIGGLAYRLRPRASARV